MCTGLACRMHGVGHLMVSVPFLPLSVHSSNLDQESMKLLALCGVLGTELQETEPIPSSGLLSGWLGDRVLSSGLFMPKQLKQPMLVRRFLGAYPIAQKKEEGVTDSLGSAK